MCSYAYDTNYKEAVDKNHLNSQTKEVSVSLIIEIASAFNTSQEFLGGKLSAYFLSKALLYNIFL